MFNDRDLEKMKTVLQARTQAAVDSRAEIIREVTREAAEDMHNRVDRIDTERMKGSVSHVVSPTKGKFGWYIGDNISNDQRVITDGDARNDYFVYQEHGFKHAGSGRIVEPMHALLGSFLDARDKLQNEVQKLAR